MSYLVFHLLNRSGIHMCQLTSHRYRALHHLDDSVVDEISEGFRVDLAVGAPPLKQLVPPAEEEVASNQLEPWREQVLYEFSSAMGTTIRRGEVDSLSSWNIACSSALSTYLWSRISFALGVTSTSAVKKRIESTRNTVSDERTANPTQLGQTNLRARPKDRPKAPNSGCGSSTDTDPQGTGSSGCPTHAPAFLSQPPEHRDVLS